MVVSTFMRGCALCFVLLLLTFILQCGRRRDRAGGRIPWDRESYVTESWLSPPIALRHPSW